ncbi:MAG TPA: filamentous hemagglutinin N-terminal domain-containing protein, partial [Verrucomicrobiae bacterium]|nr:filamentous hemagglutinin N-terminal domain-containing protein [Verrucomicrobiae bacterium]
MIQILASLVLWLFFLSIATEAQAAVTTSISPTGGTGNPASLGTVITSGASTVPTNMCSANCVITGGTRAGSNLFHSFGDFSIGTLDGARFQTGLVNPVPDASVANILGRVTGGNPSNIFGTLNSATYYPSANLFLMNPAGIVFGPNATLNVGGSVTFTTANYLRLADNALFNATPNAASDALLSAAPVAAFGFLGSNAEAITVQGSQLSVAPGQSLSLVGGNITIQSGTPDGGTVESAKLSALGGQINLASVASPGEILTGTMEKAPNINGQSFGALGTIQVLEQSVIDVSGNGGGTVLIRGGQLLLDNSTISANVTGPGPVIDGTESIGRGIDIQVSQDVLIQNGALIDTSVVGNATSGVQYGGVHVKGDHIEVRGIADFDTGNFVFTTIQANVGETIVGNSGNITLEGNSILVKDAGQIQTVTNGAGNAGNITLKANQSLDIDIALVQSAAQQTFDAAGNIKTRATGDSGNIELASAHGNISL